MVYNQVLISKKKHKLFSTAGSFQNSCQFTSVSMIARFESFDLMDFRKKNWLSCLCCSYQQDSQTAPGCCGWGSDGHWLPGLLFPEPMGGEATSEKVPVEGQLLAPAEGCVSCSVTHSLPLLHHRLAALQLLALFPQHCNTDIPMEPFIIFTRASYLCNMCLVDSQHFKLTL